MPEPAAIGAVIVAKLPGHDPSGHEQHGARPVILVGLPDRLGMPRFPMVLVTPVTSDHGQPWGTASPHLYPHLPAGSGGLPVPSIALLDQTRTVDARRLGDYLGTLSAAELAPIRDSLLRMLGYRLRSR